MADMKLDQDQQAARDWFESLRDRICAAFEEIEREADSEAAFEYTPWDRIDPDGTPGGGGADLNPPIPYEEDTAEFHARLRAACSGHDQTYYTRFSKWAEEYFFIPHRGVQRGVGGIFYDHLECVERGATFEANLAFTRDVGEAFLDVFPRLVRRRRDMPFDEVHRARQLEWRGRYAEFNLIYDRGTLFGLKTGGNVDSILSSMPPVVKWP